MGSLLRSALYIVFICISLAILLTLVILVAKPTATQTYSTNSAASAEPTIIAAPEPVLYEYVQVTSGCALDISDECTVARSGPSIEYKETAKLRIGSVLKVDLTLISYGETWYRIVFDEQLRYPERVTGRWYVPASAVRLFIAEGVSELGDALHNTPPPITDKYILVDRSDQALYAYDGEVLVMTESISTGLLQTPTPRGSFTIYKKTPTRYMQGPLPGISTQYFDLPGVPWNLYFTKQGAVIHGAYWHDSFGKQWSSGCVNVSPNRAEALYNWADLGTPVYVRD